MLLSPFVGEHREKRISKHNQHIFKCFFVDYSSYCWGSPILTMIDETGKKKMKVEIETAKRLFVMEKHLTPGALSYSTKILFPIHRNQNYRNTAEQISFANNNNKSRGLNSIKNLSNNKRLINSGPVPAALFCILGSKWYLLTKALSAPALAYWNRIRYSCHWYRCKNVPEKLRFKLHLAYSTQNCKTIDIYLRNFSSYDFRALLVPKKKTTVAIFCLCLTLFSTQRRRCD